jgi:hypothetical protein
MGNAPPGPAGQTEAEVIRRVGKKNRPRARRLTRADDLILILAGKGNNGTTPAPREISRRAQNRNCSKSPRRKISCPRSKPRWRKNPRSSLTDCFGIGLNRPLDDGWIKFIAARQRIQNFRSRLTFRPA